MSVPTRICYISLIPFILLFLGFLKVNASESFGVVAYNVENLFDVDDVSLYNDYRKGMYGINELENKLDAIVEVLQKIGGTNGPDIILLQEIEVDRTPDKHLSATEELIRELKLNGMGPYEYRLGYNPMDSPETWPAVHCLTLSKFPITESRLHWLKRARPILETTHKIDGHSFTLFNNHWKSGASSPEMEIIRIQNARVLRTRIDELMKINPDTDFLVGGDLNSHYNQSTVHKREMKTTGINDILLSQEIEPGKKKLAGKLYNLWHELPAEERGSDAWRGKWGTLMHILLPDSLYDDQGIRYVADSFKVEKFVGLNEIEGSGIPFEWCNDLNGFGTSDHFPLSARFRTKGAQVMTGNHYPNTESTQRLIDYKKAKFSAEPWHASQLHPRNTGRTYQFSGIVEIRKPLKIKIGGLSLGLYSFDPKTRDFLFSRAKGKKLSGYGNLSRYRGQWQFIIAERDWIK